MHFRGGIRAKQLSFSFLHLAVAQCTHYFPNPLCIVFILIFVEFQIDVMRPIDFQHAKFRFTVICAHQ